MELILTSRLLEEYPGHRAPTWFLDLKDGNSLHSICNGTKDHCLAQKSIWAEQLNLDGGPEHKKLRKLGLR